jgi:hypothetical protein
MPPESNSKRKPAQKVGNKSSLRKVDRASGGFHVSFPPPNADLGKCLAVCLKRQLGANANVRPGSNVHPIKQLCLD